MPKARRSKKPPADYDKVRPTLERLQGRLKEAQRKSLALDTRHSSLWPIYKLNHQISRYVYDMYYQRKAISKDLYEYLLRQRTANGDLIAKWKKQGYEKLCCVNCIVQNEKNHGTTCICRVPKSEAKTANVDGCVTCGCTGCSSKD